MINWLKRINPFVVTYRVTQQQDYFNVTKHYLFDSNNLGVFDSIEKAKIKIAENKKIGLKLVVWEE